jgi:hypothetical protein
MSVLGDIVTRWGSVPELAALVPVTRVVIGEPLPGWPVPAIALQGYLLAKRQRASGAIMDTLVVRHVIEAATGDAVEAIAQAILDHLCPLTISGRSCPTWEGYTLELTRDPATEHITGSGTITLHLW